MPFDPRGAVDSDGPYNIIYIVVMCLLVLLNTVPLLRRKSPRKWQKEMLTIAVRVWSAVRYCSRPLKPGKEATDSIAECIERRMAAKRLQRAKNLMPPITVFLSALVITFVFQSCLGYARNVTKGGETLWLVAYSIMACLNLWPSLLSGKLHFAWHVCIMMIISVGVSPLCITREQLTNAYTFMVPTRWVAGLFYLSAPVNACWGIIYVISASCAFAMDEQPEELSTPNLPTDLFQFARREALTCILLVAVLHIIERSLVVIVRHESHAEAFQNEHSAARSMLDTLCGAVLELDDNLKIKDHVQAFAGMLMLGPVRSLAGTEMQALMPRQDDRERFEICMRTPHHGCGSTADIIPVRLADSLGNHVRVELLHVRFIGLGDILHHLVGVKELSDDLPLTQRQVPPTLSQASLSQHCLPGVDKEEVVDVKFDAVSYDVIDMSAAFSRLFTASPNISEILFKTPERTLSDDGFQDHVNTYYRCVLDESNPGEHIIDCGTMTFQCSCGGISSIHAACTVTIRCVEFEEPNSDPGAFSLVAHVVLTCVGAAAHRPRKARPRVRPSSRRHSRRRSYTGSSSSSGSSRTSSGSSSGREDDGTSTMGRGTRQNISAQIFELPKKEFDDCSALPIKCVVESL